MNCDSRPTVDCGDSNQKKLRRLYVDRCRPASSEDPIHNVVDLAPRRERLAGREPEGPRGHARAKGWIAVDQHMGHACEQAHRDRDEGEKWHDLVHGCTPELHGGMKTLSGFPATSEQMSVAARSDRYTGTGVGRLYREGSLLRAQGGLDG